MLILVMLDDIVQLRYIIIINLILLMKLIEKIIHTNNLRAGQGMPPVWRGEER